MIYVFLFTLTGLALVLAIGSGLNELSRLNGEVELERTRQRSPQRIVAAQLYAESRERELISETLQNQVSTMLQNADSELQHINAYGLDNNQNVVQAVKLIRQIRAQLDDLSTSKCSFGLKAEGLEAAVKCMVTEYRTEHLKVEFTSSIGSERIDSKRETYLFRACAELIQNTIKHSNNATVCKISLFHRGGFICLRVVDNGLNSQVRSLKLGFGLSNLKAKSKKLGGDFHFKLTAFGAESEISIPMYSSQMMMTAL